MDNPKPEDTELVARARLDPEAFGMLLSRYQEPLFRYIRRFASVSKEDAEDLLQEAFVKMYRKLNEYDDSLKFSSWAYRIVHNHVIDFFRKSGARPRIADMEEGAWRKLTDTLDIHREIADKDCVEKIKNCINKLPDRYREALILRFVEEKSYEEIMDILKKPKGSVATLIARGKSILVESMRQHHNHCL